MVVTLVSIVHTHNWLHRLKISRLPSYGDLLKLGQERDAMLLDIGCCCESLDIGAAIQRAADCVV